MRYGSNTAECSGLTCELEASTHLLRFTLVNEKIYSPDVATAFGGGEGRRCLQMGNANFWNGICFQLWVVKQSIKQLECIWKSMYLKKFKSTQLWAPWEEHHTKNAGSVPWFNCALTVPFYVMLGLLPPTASCLQTRVVVQSRREDSPDVKGTRVCVSVS